MAHLTFLGAARTVTGSKYLLEADGRQLLFDWMKMFGQWVPVQARIARLNGMSAHADSDEILRWLRTFPSPPTQACLVHGEPRSQDALAARIRAELGWNVRAPVQDEKVEIPSDSWQIADCRLVRRMIDDQQIDNHNHEWRRASASAAVGRFGETRRSSRTRHGEQRREERRAKSRES